MYILAIETTGPVGSVAVIDTDRPDGSVGANSETGTADAGAKIPVKVTTRAMSHLKNLIPMTKELLSEEGIDKDEICAVAASVGPGSFTGIRIGVSTARALAQGWDVQCIAVPTLEIFREKCSDRPVCVIFNARRGQVYAACFDGSGKTVVEPGPYMLDDVLAKVEELGIRPVFYGDGVDAYFDTDEFRDKVAGYDAAPAGERYQIADMTARYALEVWNGKSEHGSVVFYDQLLPDYMRESEAEQRLRDGSLEKMRKAKMEKFMKMAGKQF